ncbi:hypothetical protein OG864_47655 [Streptomyces sp. NBC_00124]|uniref:hypothetical protein n=1 Tax=Streptomyces sp. NBC_00124 TaxID=2975662 RepID=UPI0022506E16|nr:hypothetical protein [Streptomyces sp. NBC_00124]MCX5366382.1 hypothetical protein [Streptomyces sp. NBC_00124]
MSTSPLMEPWLRGVAANSSAPSEVLLRLLDTTASTAWTVLCEQRELPADVVDAVIAHPRREIRRALARNRHVAPTQRGRLVDDADARVRGSLAGGPRPRFGRVGALPDDVLETLLTAQDAPGADPILSAAEIGEELGFSGQIPSSFRRRMAGHTNPGLRARSARMWTGLSPAQREALLADPDPAVRDAARDHSRSLDPAAMEADLPDPDCHHRRVLLTNYAVSRTVVDACLAEDRNLWGLAHNPYTPADAVLRLARHRDPRIRERIASRADLDPSTLAELSRDTNETVRMRARIQALPRTWEQRDAIDRVAQRSAEDVGPVAEMFLEPDTSWYSTCARSEHPLLRRVAATCPGLPEALVDLLADDPDTDVRHLLAYNHPLAPARTVLDAFIATPRQRPYLLTLPQLPRTGLEDFLGHEDPEVRALAAADTTLRQPPVHLLTDPDARVRLAAAGNPLLPAELVSTLLQGPDTAEGAAANPSLSAQRLHELLDLCGLPAADAP